MPAVHDPILEQAITHPISEEQQRWLTANQLSKLMTDANAKCVAAFQSATSVKDAIEKNPRLRNEAKHEDIIEQVSTIVRGLTEIIEGKRKSLKIKRKTVREIMERTFGARETGQAKYLADLVMFEHRKLVQQRAESLDEEDTQVLRIQSEDDDLSPVELILLRAAEIADLDVVGAVSGASPLWLESYQVRSETIDKARDRVMITSNNSEAAELQIIDGLLRGLTSNLKATKAAITRETGVPLGMSGKAAA